MFGRRTKRPDRTGGRTGATAVGPSSRRPATEAATDKPGGKGRPTPRRSEAEKARKQRAKAPRDRRSALRAERERVRANRARQREALKSGDARYLPRRDQGPVRAYVRDFIDARRSIGEFFILIALVVLVGYFIPVPQVQVAVFYAWTLVLLMIIADSIVLGFRLRSALRARFPDEERKGAVAYGIMRSTQFRRLRLPTPRMKPGQAI